VPSHVGKLDVLIASPGDARPARDAVEQAVHEWNDNRSDAAGMILRPRRWEMAAVPISGRGDAQSVINSQLVDSSDIVIGLFYHRLGSPTLRAASGTAEEITRSVAAGKLVHLYFAEKKLPNDVDVDQLSALRMFRREMQQSGLIGSFKSETQLRHEVLRVLEYDVMQLGGGQGSSPRAIPVLRVKYVPGYVLSEHIASGPPPVPDRFRIFNDGTAPAYNVRVTAVIDGHIVDLGECEEIAPGKASEHPVRNHIGSEILWLKTESHKVPVLLHWSNGDISESHAFEVALH
jgi:hypothetical protein